MKSIWGELKRRNVVRVGIAYGLVCWVLLQIADFVLEVIDAPGAIEELSADDVAEIEAALERVGTRPLEELAPSRRAMMTVERAMTPIGPDDLVDIDELVDTLLVRPAGGGRRTVVVDSGRAVGLIDAGDLGRALANLRDDDVREAVQKAVVASLAQERERDKGR